MWISNTSIRQPVFTTMVISALLVFGVVAYQSLGIDLFPKVDFPLVTVTAVIPGADPETVETDVTEHIEEALNTISGVKTLRSTSSEGVSIVVVEFDLERDVDQAAQDVRDKVSSIRRLLPNDLEEPVIQKLDPDATPILAVALAGNKPVREITTFAKDVVKDRLERVNGVGSIEIVGGREREIRLWLSADRLTAYGLTVDDVTRALQIENMEIPGGRIELPDRELVVRTRGRIATAGDFGDIVVAQRTSGPVYVRDVGTVEDGAKDERSLSRLNGERAVSLLIRRQSGTNTVAVAKAIKEAIDEIRRELPADYTMTIATDTSRYIEQSVDEVRFHLIAGGLFAVAVIFFFLRNVTSTLISAVAIPTSIVGTFMVIDAYGFTLNMLTLLALSLSVGMLIDDAIVVLENVFRHMEEGLPRRQAAEFGTAEIGLAVMATTFSIAAVFVPVAFMQGIIGRFFYAFGVTVTAAVLISLFVSFTLTPMLSSRFLTIPEGHGLVYRAIERLLGWIEHRYRATLAWALGHRLAVVAIGIMTFGASLYMVRFVGVEFMPQADEAQFSIAIKTAPGASLQATDDVTRQVEAVVRQHAAVTDLFATVGGGAQGKVNAASILVKLVERADRAQTQQAIMYELREKLSGIKGGTVSIEPVALISGGGMRASALQVSVRGPKTASLSQLSSVADRMLAEMRRSKGLVDIDTSYEGGKPQVSVQLDRERAAELGVSATAVGSAVRMLVGGDSVTKFQEAGDQYDVRVRLMEPDRDDPAKVERLSLRGRGGTIVPLGNIAHIVRDSGPTQIDHEARQRQIMILANLQGIVLGDAVTDVNDIAARIGMPPGFAVNFTGQAQMMAESFQNLGFALFLAVILIYMVLASQFGSFLHPLTIMLSLPMAVVGAIGGLLASGYTMSIFSMIGIILLMGLVTKNAILLIDYTNTLRERDGFPRNDALLRAGPVRLRPILMTTAAMIFGMLPIAMGLGGSGGEQRAPMAVAVIGGLITSTLLTLVLVPVVYTLLDDLGGLGARGVVGEREESASGPVDVQAPVQH